jgi:hypothetical protein
LYGDCFGQMSMKGHLNLHLVIAQDLAIGGLLVSIFKSSISHSCKQAVHHIMASSNKVIMGHSLEPTSTPVGCSVNWMGCIFSSPARLCKLPFTWLFLVFFLNSDLT